MYVCVCCLVGVGLSLQLFVIIKTVGIATDVANIVFVVDVLYVCVLILLALFHLVVIFVSFFAGLT